MAEQYIKLRCKGDMYEPVQMALEEARTDSRIMRTQVNDTGEEVFLKIPIEEAGAWILILEMLADEEQTDDIDPIKFDDLATVVTEESEKILGMKPEPVAFETREKSRNFFRGI
jgi:hypothetical protein